jgi:RES domain-containing protein
MIVYRVAKKSHATDLTGEGAKIYPGRWNSPVYPMLYTASSRSLALLEVLAHSTVRPLGRVLLTLELPAHTLINKVDVSDLPKGWNSNPHSSITQNLGDEFIRAGKFLAMQVPSVIINEESNVLINPLHPDAKKIKIITVEDIIVDPRLK